MNAHTTSSTLIAEKSLTQLRTLQESYEKQIQPVEVLPSGKIVLSLKSPGEETKPTSQETIKRAYKLRQGAVSRITEKVCNTEGEEVEETDNSVDASYA